MKGERGTFYTSLLSSSDPIEQQQSKVLETHNAHQPIPHAHDDDKGHDAARYAPRDEMLDSQVALPRLGVFHHYGGYRKRERQKSVTL